MERTIILWLALVAGATIIGPLFIVLTLFVRENTTMPKVVWRFCTESLRVALLCAIAALAVSLWEFARVVVLS